MVGLRWYDLETTRINKITPTEKKKETKVVIIYYIYCIAFGWYRVENLVIDPNTNTILQNINYGINNISDVYKSFGGVLAPNGNIYGMPGNINYVPIINTGLPKIPDWPLRAYFNKF